MYRGYDSVNSSLCRAIDALLDKKRGRILALIVVFAAIVALILWVRITK